jgi:hypothetical protein
MTKAIFFEFTFVCSVWLLIIAVICDRLDAVRRHISAQRALPAAFNAAASSAAENNKRHGKSAHEYQHAHR